MRLAFRTLFRTPFVTTIAIVSLALGIGANAAIFSIFNQFLLQPLPVDRPQQLVNFDGPGPKPGSNSCDDAGTCDEIFSYPMFRDLERQQTSFTGIAAHRSFGANLAFRGRTAKVQGMYVSGSYFPVLGLRPAQGRLIDRTDDGAPGQTNVAVLSYAYWQLMFDASPAVIGQALTVNGQPMSIVGVAPQGFDGTTIGVRPNIFAPITMRSVLDAGFNAFDNRRNYWVYLFGRLKPGVTIDQARATLSPTYRAIITGVDAPLQKGMSEQTMARFKSKDIGLAPGPRGQSRVSGQAFAPLTILMCVTGVVLLTACANIANLLLARATRRTTEMAIRLSIGASRRHLIVQLLTESVLLAAIGGVAGLLVARWTITLIGAVLPQDVSQMIQFTLDGRMLVFLAAVTLGTGLLFGLFPALNSSRPNLVTTLKGASGQPGGSGGAKRFRQTLATLQIVLSMVLLALAGLFARSLVKINQVDLGLDASHVITFGVSPQLNGYKQDRSRAIFERIEDEIAAQPGVTGVTAARIAVLHDDDWASNVSVQGFEVGPDTDANSNVNTIGPEFFSTLGMTLLSGREFTRADTTGTPLVAIVNEQFAKKFNLGRDAVGKRMKWGSGSDMEIVGLVKNAGYSRVKDPIPPVFFAPYRQGTQLDGLTFYVRTAQDPKAVMATIPPLMSRIDPTLPVEDLRALPDQVRANVFLDRFVTTLSTAFAGLATLLAAIGLYGVLAYMVAQRTREIGLRMALGATPGRVRAMVLRQVVWMTAIGGVVGLVLAIVAGLLAGSMLFEIKGYDPLVLTLSAIVLTFVALSAGFFPALRASRVDPMRALRYE